MNDKIYIVIKDGIFKGYFDSLQEFINIYFILFTNNGKVFFKIIDDYIYQDKSFYELNTSYPKEWQDWEIIKDVLKNNNQIKNIINFYGFDVFIANKII